MRCKWCMARVTVQGFQLMEAAAANTRQGRLDAFLGACSL